MQSFFRNMFGIASLAILFSTNLSAAVTASVDKNPAMADESIVLKIVADSDVQRNAFDPSPLLKDFIVGRTSVSSQTQMVNFKTTRTTIWNTVLIPRKEGTFTVPALSVGNERTQPFNVKILAVSSSSGGAARDLFITAEVDSSQVYLQQQITYTVKLHLTQNLQRGSLAAPELENAEVRQIGEDSNYSDIIGGRRYQIIERVFAIIPQKSGRFKIDGPLFQGEIADDSRQNFGFFNRTKSVSRVGPSVDLEVLPIPSGFNDSWLPSEYVELTEQWQGSGDDYVVGNPITRTITLTAIGLVEEQLPEINSDYPPQVKIYPDQASTATVEKDGTLIAQRVENEAIIPNQAGIMVIPEVIVSWFNTATKQTEYAKLPARSITVQPSSAQNQATMPITANLDPVVPAPLVGSPIVAPAASISPPHSNYWFYTSIIFIALWLTTSLGWLLHSKGRRKMVIVQDDNVVDEKRLWEVLSSALKSHKPQKIVTALADWLSYQVGLSGCALPKSQAKLNDPAFDTLINEMFASQYSQQHNGWSSDELHSYLKTIRKLKNSKADQGNVLRPLYPQTH
jgi:hypothetical protein